MECGKPIRRNTCVRPYFRPYANRILSHRGNRRRLLKPQRSLVDIRSFRSSPRIPAGLQHDCSRAGRLGSRRRSSKSRFAILSRSSLALSLSNPSKGCGNRLRARGLRPIPGPRAGFRQNDSFPLTFRRSFLWTAQPVPASRCTSPVSTWHSQCSRATTSRCIAATIRWPRSGCAPPARCGNHRHRAEAELPTTGDSPPASSSTDGCAPTPLHGTTKAFWLTGGGRG
jgi:hypothetical protein